MNICIKIIGFINMSGAELAEIFGLCLQRSIILLWSLQVMHIIYFYFFFFLTDFHI